MHRKDLPGLAFSLPTAAGFAVGLATHDIRRLGTLIWIATPTFEDEPELADVRTIRSWRWPVFFPLNAAIRRKIVSRIGYIEVPRSLSQMPTFRSRMGRDGWTLVEFADPTSLSSQPLGPTADLSVPPYQVVNDTLLKERIASGWHPEDDR